MALALLVLLSVATAAAAAPPTPIFSADRYPTGADQCAWLNWIADRTGAEHLRDVKTDLAGKIDSVGLAGWQGIGNGILTADVIEAIKAEIQRMPCTRDPTMVARCEGLSDIGCKFKSFAASTSAQVLTNPMFNKTDGAVASPPNHKVVFENDEVRVIK